MQIARRACALLLSLAIALAVSACSSAQHMRAASDTFAFTGLSGEPDSLNPLLSDNADVYAFSHLYMAYLVESDNHGELIPSIALHVPSRSNGGISSDGKTVTYHLRPGVRWQDGYPLTARDVVFSYRAEVNPANNVVTRVGYDQVASISAPDLRTVVVRLKAPFAPFTAYFFGPQGVGALMPAHLLQRYRSLNHVAYNALPVGAGPFRVVAWRRGDSVVLAANPRYWRGRPKIARIVFRIVPDPNTRLQELEAGDVDAYFDVDPQLLPRVRALPGVRVFMTPVADMHVLRFNLRVPALHDLRVRRAIAEAIDRDQLIAAATHGSGIVVNGDQSRSGWAYDPQTPAVRYDPTDARRLLRAALGSRPLDLTLVISPSGINGSTSVAAILQEDLRRVGIRATIKAFPPGAFWGPQSTGGILANGKFDLAYDAWWLLGPDPDDSFNLACDQRPPAGINFDYWCDPIADRAIHHALHTYDRAVRTRDYAIVQRRRAEQLPEITLWQVRMPDAVRRGITGIAPSPAGSIFWNAWQWQLPPSTTPTSRPSRA